MKISACLIAKNEEGCIEDALRSIADWVDEIIFVDTGSTDKTIEIAKKYTDKIYHFRWVNDFSAARNFAQTKAKYNFILTWDADWVLAKGKRDLEELKQNLDFPDVVEANWHVEFDTNGDPLITIIRPILYHKDKFRWNRPIHNELLPVVETFSRTVLEDVEIIHTKDRSAKSHRYEQTMRLVQEYLEAHPDDYSLVLMYAQELAAAGELEQAVEVLSDTIHNCENTFLWVGAVELSIIYLIQLGKIHEAQTIFEAAKNSRKEIGNVNYKFKLLEADLAVFNDQARALDLYIDFIGNTPENLIKHNKKRYQLHPNTMVKTLKTLLSSKTK